jgi:hypothetical protein
MEEEDLMSEISSIRNIMERSTRFISLSGLSGVMAGIYALIGAYTGYKMLYEGPGYTTGDYRDLNIRLFLIALAVLVFSVGTGILLTVRKAHRNGQTVWNQSSQSMMLAGALPLLTGGAFAFIMLYHGYVGIIASVCLIFYGLAVISASRFTFGDVKWLGVCEVGLGLLAAAFPGYGLFFWAFGFGVLHILYGTIMHFKYDR